MLPMMGAYDSDLLAVGGRNPYGEPVFLLVRGAHPIKRKDGTVERPTLGRFAADWVLMEWLPREEFGAPEDWPGGPLGDFPWRGRYHMLQPFPGQELGSATLNPAVARRMAWISSNHRRDSLQARRAALAAHESEKDRIRQNRIADMLHDSFPAFTGPTSFANNPTTRTAVQNKLDLLEQMERDGKLKTQRPRGQVVRELNA